MSSMKQTFMKRTQIDRTLINIGLLLLIVVPLLLVGFGAAGSLPTDPDIAAILGNVDSNRILNTAQTLQNFRTRQSSSDQPQPPHPLTPPPAFILTQHHST